MKRKAPTSQDVARLAGVSQSTVSYVLTGSRPISPSTRARVEDAIGKLGYHPNAGARTLRSRRSGVIGLMVPADRQNDAVLMTFLASIAGEARRFDRDVLVVTAHEGAAGIRRVVGTGVCDALILMEVGRRDERVAAVVASGLPFVTIGKPDTFPGGSVVDLDFERVGAMVVERALDEGCAQLLLVGGLDAKRHRNDVSRFLRGVDDAARSTTLAVRLDDGPLHDLPHRVRELSGERRARIALFGLAGVVEAVFALAVAGSIGDPDSLFIALTDEDLGAVSPLLRGVPQISPHRQDVSELAVQELMRLVEVPGAHPRTSLVEPTWVRREN